MSDNVPTERLLVKELKEVTDDWKLFGVSLGVPVRKLNTIKLDDPSGGVENWKLKMFQYWLQSQPDDRSWKDVVQALEDNNYIHLATTLSRKYLLAADSSEDEDNEEIKAEIRATAAVVERLRDLESSFTDMLTDLLRLLTKCKCDLPTSQFYLDTRLYTEKFKQCTSFDALLRQLRKGQHVDTFNTYYLRRLVAYLEVNELIERLKKYEKEKGKFLKDTTVLEFQRAVVSKVEPLPSEQMIKLTIKISKRLADKINLKDMEELALRSFGECQDFVRIHMKSGSVIISWFFPEALSGILEYLAHKNAAVFKDAGVEEVTVGGRVVFPCTLEEVIPTASLKEIYTDFYDRLVKAVSDEHTCQSLLTQLSSPALISEEKIAQLTSSKVTGSSFLKTLGLEEEPHLLVPLVSAMSGVEQLQTLAEKMTFTLKSKQAIYEEEKVCLKETYNKFSYQLVDAISDEQVCQSLSTQLRSSAVIPEEKISQLISSRASGSSFLNILGVEEQSGLVAVLIESMSAVKQLQTLASEMNDMLSSKQSAATTIDTVESAHIERKVQQQLEENIKRLTSDKADLLRRLQCCEEALKIANDLSIMRDKAVSGMLAAASRRDTGVEGTIRQKIMDLKDDSLQKDIIPDSLFDESLSELATQVCTVSHWWYPLGILLGLSCTTLKKIEVDCSGPGAMEMCLFQMLAKWLQSGTECSKQLLRNASKQLTPQLVYLSNTSAQTVSIADLSKVPDGTLDWTHLLVLITALSSVSQWWFSLGIYLGLRYSDMTEIVLYKAGQVESYMIEMLTLWMRSSLEPTKQCLQNGLNLLTHHLLSSRNTTVQQFGYCYPPPPYTRLEEPISIVDLSEVPDGTLDKSYLAELLEVLAEVYQWFPLGMHLGLRRSELHEIEIHQYHNEWRKVILCMIAMLKKWLEGPIEKRNKQCLQDALKQLTPQLVSQVYPPPTLEKPLVSMKEIQPLPVPQTDLERQAVNKFTKNVRVVIQTCDEAEYYAALERLDPPRIENYNYDKPVQYPHSELSIVVGTFAGIDSAIIAQGENFNTELETIFEDVFTSTKLLLGLGVCYEFKLAKRNNIDLKVADVVVASEIGVSQLDSDDVETHKEEVHEVAPLVYQLFCENPDTWDGMVVCEVPNKRIAKAHVGQLFSASRVVQDSYWKLRMCVEYPSHRYLGAELKGLSKIKYIPSEVKFITIKGIASYGGGNKYTKWQLTAAKAAVDYAHHKLERAAGYIDFDNFSIHV